MKSKKFNSNKFTFDLPVSKSPSIPLSLSILRDVVSDTSMSDIDYTKRVAQIANMLVGSQVNNSTLYESTIPYISVEPVVIEIVGEHMPMPYTQGIDNTTANPILESMAIPYKINQSVDPNL